jgi:hypothetical protein
MRTSARIRHKDCGGYIVEQYVDDDGVHWYKCTYCQKMIRESELADETMQNR